MTATLNKLENLLQLGVKHLSHFSEFQLTEKPAPKKWSKKEILGHLIDSGIHNLLRFMEIQFATRPYKIRNYNQDELVKANDYQNAETKELVSLWLSLNTRIMSLIKQQTETTLKFEIELDNGKISDLKFLMKDYVDHLEHHLNQIIKF